MVFPRKIWRFALVVLVTTEAFGTAPSPGDGPGGLERFSGECKQLLAEAGVTPTARTRPVKPCHELATNIYFAEELFEGGLTWTAEKFPRGVALHSNIGLSYRFEDLPKYFADPLQAIAFITMAKVWQARMSINRWGQITMTRSGLGPESYLGAEIHSHLKFVLDQYLERKIVSEAEVQEFYEEEESLSPRRTIYFTLTDTLTATDDHVGKAETVIRIYDGTPYPGFYRQSLGLPLNDGGHILPLERKHPEVVAHLRREHGDNAYLFELGRLAVSEELDYGLPAILREISRGFLLYRFRMEPKLLHDSTFVMRATKPGARLYVQKYGMKLIDPDKLLEQGAIDENQARALRDSPYRYLQSNAHDFLQAFLNLPGVH